MVGEFYFLRAENEQTYSTSARLYERKMIQSSVSSNSDCVPLLLSTVIAIRCVG